ncbi:hypothetical protein L5515_003486 [Caenorhabditis briggsae]|uniref:Uncharacterized protein n=1 Tax=Caenorhabditis briggsae TaxID=6238 RepID=A0AAE9EM82_CAEBR|nr:hypothetical protein L5515_003486 [Caenorhabditis briggsae]
METGYMYPIRKFRFKAPRSKQLSESRSESGNVPQPPCEKCLLFEIQRKENKNKEELPKLSSNKAGNY